MTLSKELQPLTHYNWHSFIPSEFYNQKGFNVLHSISANTHYENDALACQFVEQYLSKALRLESDAEIIRFASDSVTIEGAFLEMGVRIGKTINFIAALNPKKKIYGFDSFSGFQEDWDIGFEHVKTMPKDMLALEGTLAFHKGSYLPPVPKNVTLFKGYFHEVLPQFKQQILKDEPVAFLHIDCDTYSSTRDVLVALEDNIVSNTIIEFDELYNYPKFKENEWKALQEFIQRKNCEIEFIAFNVNHKQVAIRIK